MMQLYSPELSQESACVLRLSSVFLFLACLDLYEYLKSFLHVIYLGIGVDGAAIFTQEHFSQRFVILFFGGDLQAYTF